MASGARVRVPSTARQAWTVLATGRYDDEMVELAVRSIRPKSLVVDVGASLGLWTVALAAAAQRAGAGVVAVEPLPANCSHIETNLRLNGLESVAEVHQVALGRVSGEVVLHGETGSAGNASVVSGLPASEILHHDTAGRASSEIRAKLVALDELLQGDERPISLMKIDVEGFELEVLGGAARRVRSDRPHILGEFSPEWMQSRGMTRADVDRWAEANDYTCFAVQSDRLRWWSDRRRATPVKMDAALSHGELMLVPVGSVD